jgi:hypothetical protein
MQTKLILGFIAFAALVIFAISGTGGKFDVSGEAKGISYSEQPAKPAPADAPANSQPDGANDGLRMAAKH